MTLAADPAPRRRWRRTLVLLAAAALTVIAGGIVIFLWSSRTPPPQPPDVNLAGAEPLVALVIQKALDGVRAKPNSVEAWGHLGLVFRAHGYDDESDVCFARAEQLDAADPRWPYLQGSHLRFTQPDAALSFLERAVQRCAQYDPDNTAPRLLLAEVLLSRGRNAEAEEQVRQALERNPNDVRANFDMGLLALARDDTDGAVRYLTRASASPFARKKVAAQLALLYARQDDDKTAAEFNRRVRELPPDWLWVDKYVSEYQELEVGRQGLLKHAEDLEQSGRLPEGVEVYRSLLDEFPDERSRVALGIALLKVGDTAAGAEVLREAIREAPQKVQAYYFLCVALYQQGEQLGKQGGNGEAARAKFSEGAEAGRRAAELKPDHANAHLFRGLCQRELGDRAGALASLRTAVRGGPQIAEAHYLLGETLADNGLSLEALGELQAALEVGGRESPVQEKARELYLRVLVGAFFAGWPL